MGTGWARPDGAPALPVTSMLLGMRQREPADSWRWRWPGAPPRTRGPPGPPPRTHLILMSVPRAW